MSRLTEILSQMPASVELAGAYQKTDGEDPETGEPIVEEATVVFTFSEPGFGFGEIAIVQRGDEVFIDAETMSREKVVKFLERLVASATLDTDKDPVRHARYNRAMGRQCGTGCRSCEVLR